MKAAPPSTDIAAAAAQCTDVTVLIDNAGIAHGHAFTEAGSAAAARAGLETNFFGTLKPSLAFAPVLKANDGGAIVNVLSVTRWLNFRSAASYGASKSAAWSLTNALRAELKSQGTQGVAVHTGLMDTDMARGFDIPKADPLDVARQVTQGLSAGACLAQVD